MSLSGRVRSEDVTTLDNELFTTTNSYDNYPAYESLTFQSDGENWYIIKRMNGGIEE